MAWGAGLRRLSPCLPEDTGSIIASVAPAGGRILDVGCGNGEMLEWLSKHTDLLLFGIEPDGELAAAAVERCPLAKIIQICCERMIWREPFDVVLAECVFSLTEDLTGSARVIRRSLKDGGVLILSDMTSRSFEYRDIPSSFIRRLLIPNDMVNIFNSAGFKEERFEDLTDRLISMAVEMILDGSISNCLEYTMAKKLRKEKVGYSRWIFRAV